jgi:hypothetical protein
LNAIVGIEQIELDRLKSKLKEMSELCIRYREALELIALEPLFRDSDTIDQYREVIRKDTLLAKEALQGSFKRGSTEEINNEPRHYTD